MSSLNNDYYDFVQAWAHTEPWGRDVVDIRLVHRQTGCKTKVCKQIVFEEIDEGTFFGPSCRLCLDEAQELMDSLWNCGLRPTQSRSSIGQTEAIVKHLDDMRAIAFSQLDMKPPT